MDPAAFVGPGIFIAIGLYLRFVSEKSDKIEAEITSAKGAKGTLYRVFGGAGGAKQLLRSVKVGSYVAFALAEILFLLALGARGHRY